MRDRGIRWLGAFLAGLLLTGCEGSSSTGSTPRASFEPTLETRGGGDTERGADADQAATERVEPTGPATEGVEAGAPWPVPPEGYGQLQLTVPPPSEPELRSHALAGYEVVAVHDKPEIEARKIGFLRFGQRIRVTQRLGTENCVKGWYQLEGGGFACASKGLVVDVAPPFMKHEPPPPRLDQPFPYEWAYVRKWNTPMWWRLPSAEELVLMKEQQAVLDAARTAQAAADQEDPGSPPVAEADPAEVVAPGPEVEAGGRPEGVVEAEPAAPPDPDPASPDTQTPDDPAGPVVEEAPLVLPLNPQHPWLEKGFFISLAGTVREAGRGYWHTARGAFVPQSETFKYEPKDFQGIDLSGDMTWPVGFANHEETKVYELTGDDTLKVVEKVDRRTPFAFEEEVEHGGKAYLRTKDGRLVRKEQIVMPELQALPKGLQPWERWIDVSLSKQLLVAYQGTRPVYVTLVSTGKKGSEEEPFLTPIGRWRIYSKQVTSNMDGTTATDGNYAIQDVPWVMYFEGSYALHGAFWHRSFGRVRSHGCVNLGPSDARWLFNWTTPFLPEGWHGVHASDDSPGSTIIVRD